MEIYQPSLRDLSGVKILSRVETPGYFQEVPAGLFSHHFQLFLGLFDVLDCAGLEPAALMRQAEEPALRHRLMPQHLDGKFPVGSAGQNARMKNPDAGDDVGRVAFVPTDGVAGFDEEMVFA